MSTAEQHVILIVDDNPTPARMIGAAITERLGVPVNVVDRIETVCSDNFDLTGYRLALIDLSFRNTIRSGLDVVVWLRSHAPSITLALYTQGDDAVTELIAVCWHAVPLGAALSKSLPLDDLVARVKSLLESGTCAPDPVMTPTLPTAREAPRAAEAFGDLVPHAGHAKLWRALQRSSSDVSIGELAGLSGLAVNSVKNYRDNLLPLLRLHDLKHPSLLTLRAFALRCRPLLEPFVAAKLDR